MFGKYAVIVWLTHSTVATAPGMVYWWYEALATALNTATDLQRNGTVAHAVVVKVL